MASEQISPSASSTPPQESSGEQKTSLQSNPEAGSSGPGGLAWGQKVRRKLNQELKKRGVQEEELPISLQDGVVARSRKGKAGQIVVRALSGVQKSGASQLARRLEHDLSGGREDIIEKLDASGTQNQSIQKVSALLETNPKFSLARAIAEAGADVAGVLDSYAKGAKALSQMTVVLNLYKEMPHLMRDLLRHAIDTETECGVCLGVGEVPSRAGAKKLGQTCPRCRGTGKAKESSEHKAMAVQKILEMSEMLPKKTGPMVQVNQAVQVNAGGQGDLLARMSKAADEVLYSRGNGEVLDAEVVENDEVS